MPSIIYRGVALLNDPIPRMLILSPLLVHHSETQQTHLQLYPELL
jgi:hypothetical protein